MTTQFTITQAQALTLEALDGMTLEQLQQVVDVLATSEAKKSRLKIDQVKAIIEKRKKQAKKAGDKEAQAELLVVENSAKLSPRKSKKNAQEEFQSQILKETFKEEEEEEEEESILDTLKVSDVQAMNVKEVKAFLKEHFGITTPERNLAKLQALLLEAISPEEEEEEDDSTEEENYAELAEEIDASNLKELRAIAKEYNVKIPANIKATSKVQAYLKEQIIGEVEEPEAEEETDVKAPSLADMQKQFQAMQKQMKALQKENEKLKADKFPKVVETQKEGSNLVATDFPKVQDVQKALVENPFKVYMQIHEGLDATATTFVVVFMNEEKLVLVDKSRQLNSVLDLEVKHMTPTTLQVDKRDCPYQFYMMTADK